VVLASGGESADHQLVDAHLFLCSFDGESSVQVYARETCFVDLSVVSVNREGLRTLYVSFTDR